MADDYSGSIDWDTIYNTFHHPIGVAERIRAQLGSAKPALDSPIVFCGFPKVASLLSEHYQVLFVDSSPEMARRTRERYPNIHRIVHSEIETFLETNTAKTIVISGRLSAFWQSTETFQRLADAINAHPRDSVLIDYFDCKTVKPGLLAQFQAAAADGWWRYERCENNREIPPMTLVVLNIGYSVGDTDVSYSTCRAYFDRNDMEAWHKNAFKNYQTTITQGLLAGDPSFSIKMMLETSPATTD
jgi:hypothetical protein